MTLPPSLEALPAQRLRRHVDPASLGFASTAELPAQEPGWIGQPRAEAATRFGLAMAAPDYNLFVLGDVGSGRSSLLRQALHQAAAERPTPPDLCYLHHFEAPRQPLALRLPPGQGRALRQALQQLQRQLPHDVPQCLESAEFTLEADQIEHAFETEESAALRGLETLARQHGFQLNREGDRLKLVVPSASAPSGARTPAQDQVHAEMIRVLTQLREREQARDRDLLQLQQQRLKPLLERAFAPVLLAVSEAAAASRLSAWVQAAQEDIAAHIDLFLPQEADDEDRRVELDLALARLQANLLVDHGAQSGAPVVIDNNPQVRSLFGSIEHVGGEDAGPPDHNAIHGGGLLQAHGGFLMLHLQDLLDDELLWERLRRFLRSHQVQIEEPGGSGTPAGAGLQPEAVQVEVKLVLIGSPEQYYKLQDEDPEMARRFRVKVEFVDRFAATPDTDRALGAWVACRSRSRGLPHYEAGAVAALLEQSHREADDQHYQSALFGQIESLLFESAACCRARQGREVSAADVAEALQLRARRHDYAEQGVLDSISEGERLLSPAGEAVGQINALSQVDTGDHRFGVPMRISARTLAGHQGVINIEREVKLSGPIHDKGVLILQGYLDGLFSEQAPLALKASLVFEQEYDGVEGDSASCAELFALLSSLSGLPLRQDIAVTGSLNQHGEVLPVGGLNEKIESWFKVCQRAGLAGQGVLLPQRNERQLMLSHELLQAVEQGLFKVYTMRQAGEGMALLTGTAFEHGGHSSVLARARRSLQAYRRASQRAAARR